MDLLLELIRKQKMDIREIPLAEVCTPYLEYIEFMKEFDMDIAIEFLDIASTLVLIKSRTLLPKPEEPEDDESTDTEEQLRIKLIEYHRYKLISEYFDHRDVLGRDTFTRPNISDEEEQQEAEIQFSELSVYELLMAYKRSIQKKEFRKSHAISKDEYPIERKILELTRLFKSGQTLIFQHIFIHTPKRSEVIISFMAILELAKLMMMKLHQMSEFGPIHCKPADDFEKLIPKCEHQFRNVS